MTLEMWQVIERLVAMNANDPIYILEALQHSKDVDIDELRQLIASLTANVNDALEFAMQARRDAEAASQQALTSNKDIEQNIQNSLDDVLSVIDTKAEEAAASSRDNLDDALAFAATKAEETSALKVDNAIDDLVALINTKADNDAISDIKSSLEDLVALVELNSAETIAYTPRGDLAHLSRVGSGELEGGLIGTSAIGVAPNTLWYQGSGTPARAVSDYTAISLRSGTFRAIPGSRMRIEWGYNQRGLLNMFEWFVWQERVDILNAAGGFVQSLMIDNQSFSCATNTNGVPGGYDPTLDFGPTFSNKTIIEVPEMTGAWPTDGLVQASIRLLPLGAFNGSLDCMVGTIDPAAIASGFFTNNLIVEAEMVTAGPTTLIV